MSKSYAGGQWYALRVVVQNGVVLVFVDGQQTNLVNVFEFLIRHLLHELGWWGR